MRDFRELARFRHAIRRFLAFSKAAARKAGLAPQQHQALLSLKGMPADRRPTVASLAWHLEVRHHTAVELVDRLVRRGLARRVRGGRDQREVALEITAGGERILRRLSLLHRQELRRMGPELYAALGAILGLTSPGRGGPRSP